MIAKIEVAGIKELGPAAIYTLAVLYINYMLVTMSC